MSREHLTPTRPSVTRRFCIHYAEAGAPRELKIYICAGMYEDNRIAELFVRADRQGSLIGTALDAMATFFSMAIQHGVPMPQLTAKLRHVRADPCGVTRDEMFPTCSSAFDLIAQWLDYKFPGGRLRLAV